METMPVSGKQSINTNIPLLNADRILLHPFFAAVTTLLQDALAHPACPNAQSDLETVQPFFRLLDVLAAEERTCYRSNEARKMHRECNDLLRRASEAVGCMSMVFDSTGLIEVI
jgi:hypothetical protein